MFLDNLRQRSPPLRSQPRYLISFHLEHPALDVFSERDGGIDSCGPRIGVEVFSAGVVEKSFDFDGEDDLQPGVAASAVVEPDVVEGAEGEDAGFFGGGEGYGGVRMLYNFCLNAILLAWWIVSLDRLLQEGASTLLMLRLISEHFHINN
ncbi:hypothetical protein BTUL_0161g00190 [Botrytis tulipae]|uniref:Uncharacterized protein n=1 Tax=Botrytis tulipae TaxID=87230 RepID=A0A4Z1EBJ6_9HELO|nr:hypothetical protein BTUL_0161g00190 [Botrytis tulipae]